MLLFLPVAVLLTAVLAVFFLWEDHVERPLVKEGQYESVMSAAEMDTGTQSEEEELLAQLTLEEKVAQLFMVTPEALTGVSVAAAAGDATREAFAKRPVGGIIYFESNLQARAQTETMLSNMQKISMDRIGIPVLLATDEEGGRVTRIAGKSDFAVTDVGAMGTMGTEDAARAAGRTIGSYLLKLGFNMDFAPVADVAENPENSVIGDRAFSDTPEEAGKLVSAAVGGFKETGILTVLKHFPGHGSTLEDSHSDFAYNNKSAEELEAGDFLPFGAGIAAGVDMVMVGHISLPKILEEDRPASLSETVVNDLLRGKLGFSGVVVTDAMNMGAVTNHYTSEESTKLALAAGVDIILMPENFEEAYQGILKAVQQGEISQGRIDESVRRILRMKLKIKDTLAV